MFTKSERSTFPYWFAHWAAFQMTALNHNCWKPRFLFHDMEKPFLMMIWKDYDRVHNWHRKHNKHHIEYYLKHGKADWVAMAVDWECSRFTKESCPLNAYEEYLRKILKHPEYKEFLTENLLPVLRKYKFEEK